MSTCGSENISYCGLDCASCPAYIATQASDQEGLKKTAETWSRELGLDIKPEDCICDGCHPYEGSRLGGYCNECPVRACGLRKSYPNCAYCPDYACADLSRFYVGSPAARNKLDSIRKEIGRD